MRGKALYTHAGNLLRAGLEKEFYIWFWRLNAADRKAFKEYIAIRGRELGPDW